MLYYLLKNTETGEFLKGTGKFGGKTPPKLYTLGSAKSVQSAYLSGKRSAYYKPNKPIVLNIVPVMLNELK